MPLRLWLTRRPGGDYMLTRLRPVIARRAGSREPDVYEAAGEPIGVRHLCAEGIRAAGWVLQPLESRRVQFTLTPEEETPMASSHRVSVGPIVVTKIEDGVERTFWTHRGSEYANMPIEYVLQIQRVLHNAEDALIKLGEDEVVAAGGTVATPDDKNKKK